MWRSHQQIEQESTADPFSTELILHRPRMSLCHKLNKKAIFFIVKINPITRNTKPKKIMKRGRGL